MSNEQYTYKYEHANISREFNLFNEEYLSGTDVTIFINGSKIDNIAGFQYTIQEQLKPLYGYASRVYDDIAIGNRIVVGTFKVPVSNKETNDALKKYIQSNNKDSNENKNKINDKPNWVNNKIIYINKDNKDYYKKLNEIKKTTQNSNQNLIKNIQRELKSQGYNVSPTGVLDFNTKNAINEFKNKNNIKDNVYISQELLNIMSNVTSNKKYGIINTDNVPVRVGPQNTYRIIFNINKNTNVQILDKVNDFYKIKLSNGKIGYVYQSHINL